MSLVPTPPNIFSVVALKIDSPRYWSGGGVLGGPAALVGSVEQQDTGVDDAPRAQPMSHTEADAAIFDAAAPTGPGWWETASYDFGVPLASGSAPIVDSAAIVDSAPIVDSATVVDASSALGATEAPDTSAPVVVARLHGGVPAALPCGLFMVFLSILVAVFSVPVVHPLWGEQVRTNHLLIDGSREVLVGWEWSLTACGAYVWWMCWGLMSSPILWLAMAAVTYVVPPPVLARAGRDLLGVLPRRIVMPPWMPRRPDIPGRAIFFILVAALAHFVRADAVVVARSVAHPQRCIGALPAVVSCDRTYSQLIGATPLLPPGSGVSALEGQVVGAPTWAKGMAFGTWIVDSGADLVIAGSFIYPYATLLQRKPQLHIRGVDGKHTQVDALVRTVARLPDGEYVIQEVLVCDAFQIALWSTEYMACYGFSHMLAPPSMDSYVQTPSGYRVVLEHRPYRMLATCRSPASGPRILPPPPSAAPAPPVAAPPPPPPPTGQPAPAPAVTGSRPAITGSRPAITVPRPAITGSQPAPAPPVAAPPTPPRHITMDAAWDLHRAMMHAAWESISRSCNVIIPQMPPCDVCQLNLSRRTPQKAHGILSTFAGQRTHSDTWGPFMTALYYTSCRYAVAFKDDYSRVGMFVFCKDRTSATLCVAYRVYAAFMRTLGVELSGEWMSDGGPEYVSKEAFDFCDEHAIQRLLSVRYTPAQNGVAESMFRVHVPRARAALGASGLPKAAYALGMQYSMWLSNRSFSKSLGFRPFDRVPHPPPVDLHHARTLGCRVWAHQPDVDRPDKMSASARAGVFVGMSEIYKGYIVYYPDTQEFDACIHAKFDQSQLPMLDARYPDPPPRPPPPPSALPPVHVRERVRAPTIPRVPPPPADHLQMVAPRARDTAPPPGTEPQGVVHPPMLARRPPPRRLFHPLPAGAGVVPAPRNLVLPDGFGPAIRNAPRRAGSMAGAGMRNVRPRVSLGVVRAWLADTAPPALAADDVGPPDGMPVVLLLYSGGPDADGLVMLAKAFSERGAWPVPIDLLIGGRFHDLLDVTPSGVGWHLRRAAEHGDIQCMHAAIPCETFSVALDDCDMVRSVGSPWGLSGLAPDRAAKLFSSNSLIVFTIDLARIIVAGGGGVTIENPSPRMDIALPHVYWPEKAKHASLFRTKVVSDYAKDTSSVEITTPLCACGLEMQKYVTVLSTPKVAVGLRPIDGIVCGHADHPETAYGVTSGGQPAAALSAHYPWVFCVCLASAHLQLAAPSVDYSGDSPSVVTAAPAMGEPARQPSVHNSAFTFARPSDVRPALSTRRPSTEPRLDWWRPHASSGPTGLPVRRGFSDLDAGVVVVDAQSALPALGLAEEVCRAPGYVPPAGPGWWGDIDEGDLSDDGDDVFAISGGAVVQAYHACFKLPTQALKVAVRTRFSVGPGGDTLRHDIPRSYDEAAIHPEAPKLWEAMVREHNAHMDCGTWVLRPASECYDAGMSPVDCMWLFDCKVDVNTKAMLLWKARLVARGDQMVYLRDYTATYSGVVRHATWRLFLALCASLGLLLTGADVSTAYLHAPLRDHVVWMRQPKGFVDTVDGLPALCRLQMAIYGLKQSAREWAITVISWLTSEAVGFKQCVSDRYLFVLERLGEKLVLLIWVDDIFMGHSGVSIREWFMTSFKERFRVKDLGMMRQALGASVSQSVSEGWVSFSLEKYISDLARRFDLHENVAWADIPVPLAMAKEVLKSRPTDVEIAATLPVYNVLVGSITFVATFARPDLAYAAYFLATFLVRPGPVHLRLARRVLGYLSRTRGLAITYRAGSGDTTLSFVPLDVDGPDATGLPHMLADTDHGVRRSISGWLFMFAGAAASWAVRAQVLPSLSSTESELYGLSTGVCDLLVCVQVLEEMGVVFVVPVTLLTDSRGARLLSLDEAASARTRHIHRRWYFVRYHIDEGRVKLSLIKGSLNRSNFLTKPVGGASFKADRTYALGVPVVG